MPELRKRTELDAKVVADPPTELVNVPKTASEVEDASVNDDAAWSIVLLVDVTVPPSLSIPPIWLAEFQEIVLPVSVKVPEL